MSEKLEVLTADGFTYRLEECEEITVLDLLEGSGE